MKIELLYFEACPNHKEAEERIREVLDQLGVCAAIDRINVRDDAMAEELRFPGSPTIRVNGRDVFPVQHGESYGLRCRLYPAATGFAGLPDKDAILKAVERGNP